jgi:ParB-like chromosome segregation protein Spo0J
MNHAARIETLPIDALVPYARNARTHSPQQVAQIAASIREFGFTNPVLIDADGGIVAGHGRVMAAKSLGVVSIPCLRVDWLTEAQRRAYVLADNHLALQAGWDDELLAGELRALQADGFDLALAGFSDDEILNRIGEEGHKRWEAPSSGGGIQYQEKFAVLVECSGEAHQAQIYEKLVGMGLACKVLVN